MRHCPRFQSYALSQRVPVGLVLAALVGCRQKVEPRGMGVAVKPDKVTVPVEFAKVGRRHPKPRARAFWLKAAFGHQRVHDGVESLLAERLVPKIAIAAVIDSVEGEL